jgi:serine/threonine-protein kinase
VTLAEDVTAAPALAWLDDGTLLYAVVGARVIRQVPATGGASRVVWSDSTVVGFLNLTPLPGSRGVLLARGTARGWSLHALDLRDSALHDVQAGALRGFYVPTGHVVYVRDDGAMFAVAFDPGRLRTRGEPVPVQDSVAVPQLVPLFDVSDEGTLVVRTGNLGGPTRDYQLVWVDRAGRETNVDTGFTFRQVQFGANAGWALSPDGTRLALGMNTDAGDDIWVKQLPAGPAVRVTFDSSAEYRPRWTPDGRSVLFSSNRAANGLYRRPADGTGADELVLAGNIFEGQLSRDGRWLLARAGGQVNQAGGRNIGAMRIGTDSALQPLVATGFDESEIALSPTGSWLAYVSDETGRAEVFLRPFPETDSAKHQVSTAGGVAPLWSRDGRELFFVNANREMMVVPVAPGATLRLGAPRVLFRVDDDLYLMQPREYYTPYDISPDGRRFIMARRVRSRAGEVAASETPLIVTRHWFEELRRVVGGR